MNVFGKILVAVTTIFPAYQLLTIPNVSDQIALFSQYAGLAALILMAWGQILATKLPGIESVFGGLDRVYVLHKWAGIVAMSAILLHDTIDAEMEGLGQETLLTEIAETLGEISLYGLLILVVISVATFIPYHLWKWTHRAMGALFMAGVFHFVFILKPFSMTDPAGIYTGVFCLAGMAAYGWTLLPDTMRPSHKYKISALSPTGGALSITMVPERKGSRPKPGQFGILRFTGADKTEPHPFSFSKIQPTGELRVTVKALGDFTNDLHRSLAIGQEVGVQGPFGRFCRSGKGAEVWIAGGIGITPFLAWASALTADDGPIDLFFCARCRSEAPHLDEVEALAHALPNFTLHLTFSSEGTRLTADNMAETIGSSLSDARISFCGPTALRETLEAGLRRYGVTPRQFQYEEFEFRTGVGLTKLAHWILDRSRKGRLYIEHAQK